MFVQLVVVVALCIQGMMAANVPIEQTFSDNPDVEELMQQVNMNHPNALFQLQFEADRFATPEIVEIIPGRVYQAVAYQLGYPVAIVTPQDTLILIDSPEGYTKALSIIDDFRAIPAIGTKPWEAVIVTVHHGDHIWSLKAFLEDPYNNGIIPTVVWHELAPVMAQEFDVRSAFKRPRLLRQFGLVLPDFVHTHDGANPRLELDPRAPGPFPEDRLHFNREDDVIERTIGGMTMQFYSVTGYTADQICTYFPDFKIIHMADVQYFSFPNLYTLRGEQQRNAQGWAEDMRTVSRIPNVDIMVSTHMLPVYGQETIQNQLLDMADAVQFMNDQVLRYMQKGYTADVISTKFVTQLPPTQRERPYLKEVYGVIETAAKGISDYYVGWFSGESEDLFTLNRDDRRKRMHELVPVGRMMSEAKRAYLDGDYRWSMELASTVWLEDKDNKVALTLRTLSAIRLAESQVAVTSRHYLLTTVLEDWGLVPNNIFTLASFRTMAMDGVFQNLQTKVNAEKIAADQSTDTSLFLWSLCMKLDTGNWSMKYRNSVLVYEPVSECSGLTLEATESSFRNALATVSEIPSGVVSIGDVIDGTRDQVEVFFSYMDFVEEG